MLWDLTLEPRTDNEYVELWKGIGCEIILTKEAFFERYCDVTAMNL